MNVRNFSLKNRCSLIFAIVVIFANWGQAQTIPVPVGNPSFETLGAENTQPFEGEYYSLPAGGPWVSGTNSSIYALYNMPQRLSPFAFNAAANGNVAMNMNFGTDNGSMSQDLHFTVNPGDVIILNFAIGQSLPYDSSGDTFGTGPVKAQILVNGTPIASQNFTSTAGEGNWQSVSLTGTVTTGGDLSITFTAPSGGNAPFLDNVSVNDTLAAPVVQNGSFETLGAENTQPFEGEYYSLPAGGPWVSGTNSSIYALYNMPQRLSPFAFNAAANGNVAMNMTFGTDNGTLSQDLHYSVNPGEAITLNFAIGQSLPYDSSGDTFGTGPVKAQILVNGTPIASQNFTATAGEGNWQSVSLTGTVTTAGDLSIAFVAPSGGNPPWLDNVSTTMSSGPETIGGGSLSTPAMGPPPSFGIGGSGFTLVKNWHFGTDGTIPDIATMNTEFQYHDQFGTINNGGKYGSDIVAPDAADAISGQPVEGVDTSTPVRAFLADSLRTYLVPLDGATTVVPSAHNAGSGSFQAKWSLPNGGALLGHDILWETRVRYVTPPYFWFAIWSSGNQWNNGAEMDLMETYGFDNGGGSTNFNGAAWSSHSVGGADDNSYANFFTGMANAGITSFDPTQYHTWDWLYHTDDTYEAYMDGILIQSGTIHWTFGAGVGGTPVNLDFIFDALWGSTVIAGDNFSLPASSLAGTYYEWNYSRVYLR